MRLTQNLNLFDNPCWLHLNKWKSLFFWKYFRKPRTVYFMWIADVFTIRFAKNWFRRTWTQSSDRRLESFHCLFQVRPLSGILEPGRPRFNPCDWIPSLDIKVLSLSIRTFPRPSKLPSRNLSRDHFLPFCTWHRPSCRVFPLELWYPFQNGSQTIEIFSDRASENPKWFVTYPFSRF